MLSRLPQASCLALPLCVLPGTAAVGAWAGQAHTCTGGTRALAAWHLSQRAQRQDPQPPGRAEGRAPCRGCWPCTSRTCRPSCTRWASCCSSPSPGAWAAGCPATSASSSWPPSASALGPTPTSSCRCATLLAGPMGCAPTLPLCAAQQDGACGGAQTPLADAHPAQRARLPAAQAGSMFDYGIVKHADQLRLALWPEVVTSNRLNLPANVLQTPKAISLCFLVQVRIRTRCEPAVCGPAHTRAQGCLQCLPADMWELVLSVRQWRHAGTQCACTMQLLGTACAVLGLLLKRLRAAGLELPGHERGRQRQPRLGQELPGAGRAAQHGLPGLRDAQPAPGPCSRRAPAQRLCLPVGRARQTGLSGTTLRLYQLRGGWQAAAGRASQSGGLLPVSRCSTV